MKSFKMLLLMLAVICLASCGRSDTPSGSNTAPKQDLMTLERTDTKNGQIPTPVVGSSSADVSDASGDTTSTADMVSSTEGPDSSEPPSESDKPYKVDAKLSVKASEDGAWQSGEIDILNEKSFWVRVEFQNTDEREFPLTTLRMDFPGFAHIDGNIIMTNGDKVTEIELVNYDSILAKQTHNRLAFRTISATAKKADNFWIDFSNYVLAPGATVTFDIKLNLDFDTEGLPSQLSDFAWLILSQIDYGYGDVPRIDYLQVVIHD